MAERLKLRERERKLELSSFTHNLSSAILTEGNGEIGADIGSHVYAAFNKGSLAERNAYWKESAAEKNFGTQMLSWMGRGENPGISQWVANQSDSDVVGMLSEIGLKGNHEKTKQDLQKDNVQHLISVINTDLVKIGQPELSADTLSEDEARSLIFYATYLTGTNGPADTKSLVDTLAGNALQTSSNTQEAIAKLQKITPLLSTVGEDAQQALGALLVTKTRAVSEHDKLKPVAKETQWNDAEKEVLVFFDSNMRENTLPLEHGEQYDIADVLSNLEPPATKSSSYWVDHEIPADFVKSLTPEQVKSLEQRLPLFIDLNPEEGTWRFNRDVFDPAYTLETNKRFKNAESLTYNDSGLFALAATAAPTPEMQANLYKTLGETILRVHRENPKLLQEFLEAQPKDSQEIFNFFEGNRPQFVLAQSLNENTQAYTAEVTKLLPGIDITSYEELSKLTPDQRKVLEGVFMRQRLPIYQKVMGDLQTDQDRVLALDTVYKGDFQIEYAINIPKTVDGWKDRMSDLQEALQFRPLTLAPEEIRQIEFLAHSVNVVQVMEWLGATAPVVHNEPATTPETQEASSQSVTLSEFLAGYDNLEEKIREQSEVASPRQELLVRDSTHMAEFATDGMNVLDLEVTEGAEDDKKLAIFKPTARGDGLVDADYNRANPFLNLLDQDNTISEYTLAMSQKEGYGPNTLLAFAFEAAATTSQREALIKNLFAQIRSIYLTHDDAREGMHTYLQDLLQQSQYEATVLENNHADRLFGSQETMVQRLAELSDGLTSDRPLTKQDLRDIALFALPFNLLDIARRMQFAQRYK